MTYPTLLPPSHDPLELESFVEYSHSGLFAAPWLERPDPLAVVAAQRLSRSLAHAPASQNDWTPALSHLMEVRSHCLQAATALDPIPARQHYTDALRACTVALNILHHATEGPGGALATWALGVHTLIQAQLAVPDLAESERLARQATITLSGIGDPTFTGAEQDVCAATRLAREPLELRQKLRTLTDRVLDLAEYYRWELSRQETQLNERLTAVVQAHTTAFRSGLLWGLLNLALMAALPLNGPIAPRIPWSLPFALAVPVLWWLTWDRPYRNGLLFFDWIRSIKLESISQFSQTVRSLSSPAQLFREGAAAILREGRANRELMAAYYLFTLPSDVDMVDDAAQVADESKAVLTGEWCVELKDSHPWPLTEMVMTGLSTLPNGIRIYYR